MPLLLNLRRGFGGAFSTQTLHVCALGSPTRLSNCGDIQIGPCYPWSAVKAPTKTQERDQGLGKNAGHVVNARIVSASIEMDDPQPSRGTQVPLTYKFR